MNPSSTKSIHVVSFLTFVTLVINGCSWSVGQFTMITTRSYDPSTKYVFVGRFTGEDILFFGRPDVASAVNKALEAGKGTYLANAEIRWYSGFFTQGYEVTGDVYAPARQSDLTNPSLQLYQLKIVNGNTVLQSGSTTLIVRGMSY
jgi:hypothetical protein